MGRMLSRFVADIYSEKFLSQSLMRLSELAPEASEGAKLQLSLLPLLLPEIVELLETVITNGGDNNKARALAAGLISYVNSPLDILPDDESGPLGFLDDCLVCIAGLRYLDELEFVANSPLRLGAEELYATLAPKLDCDLRASIERFVSDLAENTATVASTTKVWHQGK